VQRSPGYVPCRRGVAQTVGLRQLTRRLGREEQEWRQPPAGVHHLPLGLLQALAVGSFFVYRVAKTLAIKPSLRDNVIVGTPEATAVETRTVPVP